MRVETGAAVLLPEHPHAASRVRRALRPNRAWQAARRREGTKEPGADTARHTRRHEEGGRDCRGDEPDPGRHRRACTIRYHHHGCGRRSISRAGHRAVLRRLHQLTKKPPRLCKVSAANSTHRRHLTRTNGGARQIWRPLNLVSTIWWTVINEE